MSAECAHHKHIAGMADLYTMARRAVLHRHKFNHALSPCGATSSFASASRPSSTLLYSTAANPPHCALGLPHILVSTLANVLAKHITLERNDPANTHPVTTPYESSAKK
jgi:hypothetical protein